MYELLLACNVALLGIAASVYLRLPCASIMHPGTWIIAFHGLIFVIRPIFAYYYGYDLIYIVYSFTPSDEDKITAILVANISFIFMLFSSCLVGNLPYSTTTKFETIITRENISSFYLITVILAPFSIYALADTIINPVREGMEYVSKTGQTVNTTNNGYLQEMQALSLPLIVGLAWLNRFRFFWLAPAILYVIGRASTGGRWPIVVCFIWLMILYLIEKRRRWIDWRYFLGAIAVWTAFAAVGSDRGDSIRSALFGYESQQSTPRQQENKRPLESMDFANLEFLEYVIYVVPQRSNTYDYYLTHSRVITEPIPRVWWKDKPVGAPFYNVDLWEYGTPIGMTLSVAGTGWFDAGWIGVVIWSILFGSTYGWLYNSFARNRQNPFLMFGYALMIALSPQLFRDGILLSVFKFTLFTASPILIWRALNRFDNSQIGAARLRIRQPDVAGKIQARRRLAKRSILGRRG